MASWIDKVWARKPTKQIKPRIRKYSAQQWIDIGALKIIYEDTRVWPAWRVYNEKFGHGPHRPKYQDKIEYNIRLRCIECWKEDGIGFVGMEPIWIDKDELVVILASNDLAEVYTWHMNLFHPEMMALAVLRN